MRVFALITGLLLLPATSLACVGPIGPIPAKHPAPTRWFAEKLFAAVPHIVLVRVKSVYNEPFALGPPSRTWLTRRAIIDSDVIEVIKGGSQSTAWQDVEGTSCSVGELSLAPGTVRILYYRDTGELIYRWSTGLWQGEAILEELRKVRDTSSVPQSNHRFESDAVGSARLPASARAPQPER